MPKIFLPHFATDGIMEHWIEVVQSVLPHIDVDRIRTDLRMTCDPNITINRALAGTLVLPLAPLSLSLLSLSLPFLSFCLSTSLSPYVCPYHRVHASKQRDNCSNWVDVHLSIPSLALRVQPLGIFDQLI